MGSISEAQAEQMERLARLIRDRNAIDDKVARVIGRPAEKGHVGEYIAAVLFGITLEESAVRAGYDGRFADDPLAGKTVNVKWYAKREGGLDIREDHLPDYFLVLAGPAEAAENSRGQTRPWLIEEVFLFEAGPLLDTLRERGVKIGIATSVRREEWEKARIYPADGDAGNPIPEETKALLALFGHESPEKKSAGNSHLSVPMRRPEDVISHLGSGEKHWRKGYSARELAESWFRVAGIPDPVRSVLKSCPDYADATLIDGFFERKVALGSAGADSQTDLMVIAMTPTGPSVIAVEGKVNEPFGEKVGEWNDGSPGKVKRLEKLCGTLGLFPDSVADLRYQLLHRTASAVYEAHRYGSRRALMLVHSFSGTHASFDDFADFARTMEMPVAGPDMISEAKDYEGVALRLGWVADRPAAR